MKQWLIFLVFTGLIAGSTSILRAVQTDEEQALIQVLQSGNAGPREKDGACARLKIIGTARSVPALAALLVDDQLSHSARYALEPMQTEEAGRALIDALGKTKNALRVGIINSLGVREQKDAESALAPLLADTDQEAAAAAGWALGRIGGPDAVTVLRACARSSGSTLHEAAVDALLRCANRMMATGQRSMALAVFEQLDSPKEKDAVRVGAFRGRVAASGNAGLDMVLHAIAGPAGPSQVAALQMARGLQVPHTTRELARVLPSLEPPVQSALIEALGQREDASVIPLLRTFAATATPETWGSIIRVFDELGDASVVPLLAAWAASGLPEVQRPAREALADLYRGNVTQTLIEQLGSANPATQAELARALAARRDKAAVPRLVDLAQHGPAPARKGVLQALSVLVDNSQIDDLVGLVLQSQDQTSRAEAAEALNSACQRIQTQQGHVLVAGLVQAAKAASNETRCVLLPICSGLVDPSVRAALRASLQDQDAQVHTAALRAFCDTVDADLMPDLLQMARMAQDDSMRSLAIAGTVRLVTQEDSVHLTSPHRVAALKALLACATTPDQKRKVLAGLGELPDVEALKAVESTLDDAAVRNEAARAVVKITAALPGTEALACISTLKKALTSADEDGTRRAVQDALKHIQDLAK